MFSFSFENLNKAVQVVGNILAPLPEDEVDDLVLKERENGLDRVIHGHNQIIEEPDSSPTTPSGQEQNNYGFDYEESSLSTVNMSNMSNMSMSNEHEVNIITSEDFETENNNVIQRNYLYSDLSNRENIYPLHLADRLSPSDSPITLNNNSSFAQSYLDNSYVDNMLEMSVAEEDEDRIPKYPINSQTPENNEISENSRELLAKEQSKNNHLTLEIKKLNDTIDRLASHQDALEALVKEKNIEITRLSSIITVNETKINNKEMESDDLSNTIQEMSIKCAELENEVALSKSEAGEYLWAMQREEKEVNKYKQQLEELQQRLASLPTRDSYDSLANELIISQNMLKDMQLHVLHLETLASNCSTNPPLKTVDDSPPPIILPSTTNGTIVHDTSVLPSPSIPPPPTPSTNQKQISLTMATKIRCCLSLQMLCKNIHMKLHDLRLEDSTSTSIITNNTDDNITATKPITESIQTMPAPSPDISTNILPKVISEEDLIPLFFATLQQENQHHHQHHHHANNNNNLTSNSNDTTYSLWPSADVIAEIEQLLPSQLEKQCEEIAEACQILLHENTTNWNKFKLLRQTTKELCFQLAAELPENSIPSDNFSHMNDHNINNNESVEAFYSQLTHFAQRYHSNKIIVKELQEELLVKQQLVDSLSTQLLSLSQDNATNQLQPKQQNLHDLQVEKEQLFMELQFVKKSWDDLQVKYLETQQAATALQAQLDITLSHNKDLERIIITERSKSIDSEPRVQTLRSDTASITQHNSELKASLETTSTQLANITQHNSELKASLETTSRQLANITQHNSELKASLETTSTQLANITQHNSELKASLETTSRQLANITQHNSELKTSLETTSTQLANITQHNSELKASLETTSTQLANITQHNSELKASLETTSRQLAELSETRVVCGREFEALSASSNLQINTLKQQLQKSENESRQLHQVVSQLRQVRKVTKEDVDTVIAERDELRRSVDSQTAEIERLKQTLSAQAVDQQKLGQLWVELTATRNRLEAVQGESDRRISVLESTNEDLRRRNGQLQQIGYENQSALEVALADTMVLRQDLTRSEIELRNLNIAIKTIERDRDQLRMRISIDKSHMEETLRRQKEAEVLVYQQQCEVQLTEARKRLELTVAELEEERLVRRKAEMDVQGERKRLQKALEVTLQQLHHTQEDTVDRALITNLVVTYFRRKRSREILELIAKILGFTEEQKVVVGLRTAETPATMITSLFSNLLGVPPASDTLEVEGDNLAELWVNYLLHESETPTNSSTTTAKVSSNSHASPRATASTSGHLGASTTSMRSQTGSRNDNVHLSDSLGNSTGSYTGAGDPALLPSSSTSRSASSSSSSSVLMSISTAPTSASSLNRSQNIVLLDQIQPPIEITRAGNGTGTTSSSSLMQEVNLSPTT